MQDLIAFQVTLDGSADNLPSHPVKNGVTIINNSASDQVAIGNSSAVTTSTGALLNDSATDGNAAYIPLPGGNTNQVWVVGTSGQTVSVVGT